MNQLVNLAIGLLLAWLVYGAYQRLYASPIAHIPGPKLAALTFWYEFYYDVIKKGRYEWQIAELHKAYGPVIRINPFEVHFADSDFYDTIYVGSSSGRKVDKWPFAARLFAIPGAMFGTVPHDHHRIRRGALNNYFSKQAIYKLEPVLYENLDKLMGQIKGYQKSGQILSLSDMLAGFSGDVIMDYCFGTNMNLVEDPVAQRDWHSLWINISGSGALAKQFEIYGTIIRITPPWIAEYLDDRFRLFTRIFNVLNKQILGIKERGSQSSGESERLLMNELAHGRLPDSEKTNQRLFDESYSIVAAGTLNSSEMLSATMFHLISEPEIMNNLRKELDPIMKRTNGRPTQTDVEQLPFLNAVIKEGLRLYYGVSQRLPRIHDADVHYKNTLIPKGTPMSMSAMQMHSDPAHFPYPETFKPDRWLDAGSARLDRYLVPFSKGTRNCIGQPLAWAELYLGLSNMCAPGRFEFELFETDLSDVKIEHDFFIAYPRLGTKGVRVYVK